MKIILWILRISVGLLFIFSGLVKANDPLGLTYKMNEFFEVWGMNFMLNYSLGLSVCMIAFEIIAGFAMIVGNYFRLYITLMLLLNIFFTFLTGYALYSGKIKECGCFGDCIKISNTATFYKDIALTAAVLFMWIFRYRVFPIFNKSAINFTIVLLGAFLAIGSQWWVLHHLPYHDCLPYKVGNNIWEKMKPEPWATDAEFETTFTYEKNGVKQKFTAENYPWKDPSWKFVNSESVEVKAATGQSEIHDFSLTDEDGNDVTEDVLTAKGYVYIWFLREPGKAHIDNIEKLKALAKTAAERKIPFYVACSAGRDICETYQEAWNMKDVPFLIIDGTVSKTVMRTNPGLMLLRDGVVQNKWSYKDYPADIAQ